MAEVKLNYNSSLLAELGRPAEELRSFFRANKGARIGQSTVASQKMHTVEPNRPEVVTVLQNVDAGRTFYRRAATGEVYHLDIFHECGQVDHRQVAAALRKAAEFYEFHHSISHLAFFGGRGPGVNADMVDVQTGTGGGRITGSLNYGQKPSLRRAHENHVHVAVMMPEAHLACLFYFVMAAEEAIVASGLELRRNEQIVQGRGGGGQSDLSAYSDQSDSFLRQKDRTMPATLRRHQHLQDMTDLADDFDTARDIREVLDEADGGVGEAKLNQSLARRGSSEKALRRLEALGIVAVEGSKVRLTDYGKEFSDYLSRHLPEIEAYIRRSFQLFRPPVWRPGCSRLVADGTGGTAGPRRLQPRDGVRTPGELAVAETVNAAARRAVAEERSDIAVAAADLRDYTRKRSQKAEICLLIDASASMTGQRIRAAKFLARHLLLSTPDRLAILSFQEVTAKVVLPLTRDWNLAEESLRQIVSGGSTPLAGGLQACLRYLQEAGARNPLIILITDGIPTVSTQSNDPLADALTAAAEIRRHGYGFACIGLKPHRGYLAQLAEAAGGSSYMLEELDKHALVKSAWNERAIRQM